jgi:hypothetical protein
MFASQTIATAFDSHSTHQEDNVKQSLSHRTIDESHKSHQEGALTVSNNDADNTEKNQFDCHHCCHCHAPSGVYIACNDKSNLLHKGNDNVLLGKVTLISLWISPEHRPPIV